MIIMARKYEIQYGIASSVRKGYHIPMFDLDSISYKKVCSFAKSLQHKYQLGNAYVIESSPRKYHLMFLDIIGEDLWIRILMEGFPMEKKHLGWALLRGFAVLRISPKNRHVPKLVGVIYNKIYRLQSIYHRNFLAVYYANSGLPLPDGKYKLRFHSYKVW